MLCVKRCPNFAYSTIPVWINGVNHMFCNSSLHFKRGFLLEQCSDIVVVPLHNNTNNQKGMTWTEGNCKSLTIFQLLSNKSNIV